MFFVFYENPVLSKPLHVMMGFKQIINGLSEYYFWALRMEDHLYGIDPEVWNSVVTRPLIINGLSGRKLLACDDGLQNDQKKHINHDIRALKELRMSIPNQILVIVQNCHTAKAIWDKLQNVYEGNEQQKKSQITSLLSEFREFKMTQEETIDQTSSRFNELLSKLEKVNVMKDRHEINVTFLYSLRREWKMVATMLKGHERMSDYELSDIVGFLKNHETDVMNDLKDKGKLNSLALVGKTKKLAISSSSEEASSQDENSSPSEHSDESSDEQMKALFTDKQKRFLKKKFDGQRSGGFRSSWYEKRGEKRDEKRGKRAEGEKVEKVSGDSGYDFHFCHGKNHFAKDCMLKRINSYACDKSDKAQRDDVAHYAAKLKEADESALQLPNRHRGAGADGGLVLRLRR